MPRKVLTNFRHLYTDLLSSNNKSYLYCLEAKKGNYGCLKTIKDGTYSSKKSD